MELATQNKSGVILSEGSRDPIARPEVEGPRYSSHPPDISNRSNENERAEKPIRILDIGTGSGAIAIALAHHLPQAHVTATDISTAALAIAKENAARHNARIDFLESDLLDSLSEERYEVLVSNPPYVPDSDRATLHPQVRNYEPATALFAGVDGLAIYRRLIPQARAALTPNGLLALEIGHGQRDAIAALLSGWNSVRFLDDLQSIPRVALARRP